MSRLQELVMQMKKYKSSCAIIHKTAYRTFEYSFSELFSYVEKMNHLFVSYKIKKGDRVLIWGNNSAQWTVALLGCFMNGIIAVPIDIRHSPDVVKRIKTHSGAKLLFAATPYPSMGLKKIVLEDLFYVLDALTKQSKSSGKKKTQKQRSSKNVAVKDSELAQIVYTSGTTGTPKGVMITHKNLSSNIEQIRQRLPLKNGKLMLNVLPLSHLFGQTGGCLYPLIYGLQVLNVDVLKPSVLLSVFKDYPVNYMPVVPRILQTFYHKLPFPKSVTAKFMFGKDFEYFVVGGAALDPETEHFFHNVGYGAYVGYGLTETSPVLTANGPDAYCFQSAGVTVADTALVIAKDGEVLAKGPQVFSGYYKDLKRTKEVLKKGWFHTGDIGKIDAEGFLHILGRKKDIIVTSAGVNVYPLDIENLLNKQKGVTDSCVIGIGEDASEVHAVFLLSKKVNVKHLVDETNTKLDDASKIVSYSIWHEPDFPRTPTKKIKKFTVKQYVESTSSKKSKSNGDKLYQLVAGFTKKKITEKSTLESLGISSLDRVELVSLLEQIYARELDEDQFTGTLTISDLRNLVDHPVKGHKPTTWQIGVVARFVRRFVQPLLYHIFAWPFCRVSVKGLENLDTLDEPCYVIMNHESHFDVPTLYKILPSSMSHRLCPAAWKEFFDSTNPLKKLGLWLLKVSVKMLYPIFLLPQQSGPMKSLQHSGWLLDQGWNVLIYPEGRRNSNAKMSSFKQGIGLLVKHTKAPVVVVKAKGLGKILPSHAFIPRPGKVEYTIGKVQRFTAESPIEITKKLEKYMKNL